MSCALCCCILCILGRKLPRLIFTFWFLNGKVVVRLCCLVWNWIYKISCLLWRSSKTCCSSYISLILICSCSAKLATTTQVWATSMRESSVCFLHTIHPRFPTLRPVSCEWFIFYRKRNGYLCCCWKPGGMVEDCFQEKRRIPQIQPWRFFKSRRLSWTILAITND